MYVTIFISLAASLGTAVAQDSVPAQASAIISDINEYAAEVIQNPAISSLEEVIATAIPPSQQASMYLSDAPTDLFPVPTITNIQEFATEPLPEIPTPTWITALPSGQQSDLLALQTSIFEGAQSIVASHLEVMAPEPTAEGDDADGEDGEEGAGARPTPGLFQVAAGVMAGALGVAAIVL